MNEETRLGLYEFIYNRHLIFYKKEILKEPPPWSIDPVMSKYRMCNMYRELDKGTKYIIDLVLQNDKISIENKLFNTVCYRFFNTYGVFERVFDGTLDIDTFEVSHYEKLLDDKRRGGITLFNDAYITTPIPFNKEYRQADKHVQILFKLEHLKNKIKNENYAEKFLNGDTVQDQINVLKETKSVGDFLGGQIYLDTTYISGAKFTGDDFLIIGPGAEDGLKLLSDNPKLRHAAQVDLLVYIQSNSAKYFQELKEKTGKDFDAIKHKSPFYNCDYFSIMDYQHIMCEYRKYTNWNNVNRKSKKRYYIQKIV